MSSSNFRALMRQRGKIVPGSRREGHNVFTDIGRAWLSHLIVWSEIADGSVGAPSADLELLDLRIRWLQIGSGSQLEAPQIRLLSRPLVIQSMEGGDLYLKEVAVSFPFVFGARYTATYDEFEILPQEAIIQEAGLCLGALPSSLPMGTSASVDWEAGYTRVTGLTGLAPWMEGMFLTVSGTDNDAYGSAQIRSVYSASVADLVPPSFGGYAPGGADSHNGSIQWCLGGSPTVPQTVVAYKTFDPLVKTRDFQLEIQWDLRF